MTNPPKIWIIIPCYNEGDRLPLESFKNYLNSSSGRQKFLFVNDGSLDNTSKVIAELNTQFPDKTEQLTLDKNSGKAEAIRQGYLKLGNIDLNWDYVGFMDADLSTPLEEIIHFEKTIEKYEKPAMIIGSRIKLFGSTNIIRSDQRHYIGRIIATLISKSLKLPIYDTQCGFKFIRKDIAISLFEEKFISRWLFDVELIFRLLVLKGYKGINGELYEEPVNSWTEKGQSRIPLSYAFKLPFELLKIKGTYRNKIESAS